MDSHGLHALKKVEVGVFIFLGRNKFFFFLPSFVRGSFFIMALSE